MWTLKLQMLGYKFYFLSRSHSLCHSLRLNRFVPPHQGLCLPELTDDNYHAKKVLPQWLPLSPCIADTVILLGSGCPSCIQLSHLPSLAEPSSLSLLLEWGQMEVEWRSMPQWVITLGIPRPSLGAPAFLHLGTCLLSSISSFAAPVQYYQSS